MEKENLKFYIVSEEYIEYLSKYDTHVSWNKEKKRPYIGIVLKVETHLYFAPLYSYKVGYDKYKENPSFMRIKNRKGRNVSIVRFAEMIPVPESEIKLLDFKARDDKYRDLLQAENDFINDNKEMIYSKAKKIYRNVVKIKIPFFTEISCNFRLLEQKAKEYCNGNDKSKKLNINETEITCEVYDDINILKNELIKNKFRYVEEFVLDDIYMFNPIDNKFGVNDGKITDTLIIRSIDDKEIEILCKNRQYKNDFEIGTEKTNLKVENVEIAEKSLNSLGYEKFLRMIDKNYKYENEDYNAIIQEVNGLGLFLEIEVKNSKDSEIEIQKLIEFAKSLNLRIGTKFDVRKAELLYKKINNA